MSTAQLLWREFNDAIELNHRFDEYWRERWQRFEQYIEDAKREDAERQQRLQQLTNAPMMPDCTITLH